MNHTAAKAIYLFTQKKKEEISLSRIDVGFKGEVNINNFCTNICIETLSIKTTKLTFSVKINVKLGGGPSPTNSLSSNWAMAG